MTRETITHIDRAASGDAEEILQLVEQNDLPTDGLQAHLGTALVARQGGRIVGTAALELYADGALLRSVAVAPELQHRGVGRLLTDAALALARELGAPAVYLLTTTAEEYFPKFGFQRIERTAVPPTLQASVELTSACPSTACVMRKAL